MKTVRNWIIAVNPSLNRSGIQWNGNKKQSMRHIFSATCCWLGSWNVTCSFFLSLKSIVCNLGSRNQLQSSSSPWNYSRKVKHENVGNCQKTRETKAERIKDNCGAPEHFEDKAIQTSKALCTMRWGRQKRTKIIEVFTFSISQKIIYAHFSAGRA